MNVLVFAGSTRKDSYNKQLASIAAEVATSLGGKVTLIDLKDYPMPLYDADLEKEGMPKNAKHFRDLMIESDLIAIAAPEYNHSIPAVLKNAIDWASRDEKGGGSKLAFKGKYFALMSASPGKGGGARGLVHLRAVLEDLGGRVIEKETIVPNAYGAFTSDNISQIKIQLRSELEPAFTKQTSDANMKQVLIHQKEKKIVGIE